MTVAVATGMGRYRVDGGHPKATAYMKGPFKFVELDVGHWLPTEAEKDVLDNVLVHLQASSGIVPRLAL